MSRISDLITDIRDTLADVNGTRWADTRLVSLIQDAQEDIVLHTGLLRAKTTISLVLGQSEYSLPSDTLCATRARFNGSKVHFKSHAQMDAKSDSWETTEGNNIEFIIYDKQNRKNITIYPIPTSFVDETSITTINEGTTETLVPAGIQSCFNNLVAYGIDISPTELSSISVDPANAGIIVDATDFTFSSDYGVSTDISTDDVDFTDSYEVYGLVTDFEEILGLVVNYTRRPNALVDVNSELEIDETWNRAIRYYVHGMALKDDSDTQNRTWAADELKLYDRELGLAEEISAVDGVKEQHVETTYNSGF